MTNTPPIMTDQPAQFLRRNRATTLDPSAMFLRELASDEAQDRLSMVNRTFKNVAVVTPFPDLWENRLQNAHFVRPADNLGLEPQAFDLVIHDLCLHWANDPVGQLVQSRLALQPDGFFLATLFGGQTLHQLRTALATAESRTSGGLSPRVAPMAEIRDLGGLLQRAGLALPVADAITQTATYESLTALMHDLRAMAETNVLAARLRTPSPRKLFDEAAKIYAAEFSDDAGRLQATFELIVLSGWAPHPDQQQPLKPGSASHSLADVLADLKLPPKD